MADEGNEVARSTAAAGALFVDAEGRVLLVRKTYGNRWDIPGGYVDADESPTAACGRELLEEIGLSRAPRRVLVVDWASAKTEGDKVVWVFDCGELGSDEQRIRLDFVELDHWEWVPFDELDEYVIPRLARRLKQACAAREQGEVRYLERGRPPF